MNSLRYAGFWRRLYAALIDYIVLIPFVVAGIFLMSQSREISIVTVLLASLFGAVYNILFLSKWGQTIGKMAAGVRVQKLSGETIEFRQAFLRHAVDFFLSILAFLALLIGIFSISETTFESSEFVTRWSLVRNACPCWMEWVLVLSKLWFWSEFIVLLTNKKKRALHDYIAGTVVVYSGKRNPA